MLTQFCSHVDAVRQKGGRGDHHDGWLYNLFGFDVVLDRSSDSAVRLLEINSFPAIAGGTMGQPSLRPLYARLVDDTLRLLAPILDAAEAEAAAVAGATVAEAKSQRMTSVMMERLGGFVDVRI